ncbi:MAG: hypothetical protein GX564_13060 [Oligosphaeraceae bacterium]|nr:hypothetical protein [Oligosphaeraceae bacterium]
MLNKIKIALRLLFCFQAIFCLRAKAAEFNLSESLIYLDHFTANGIYQPEASRDQILHWAVRGERATLQGPECNLSGFELSVHNPTEGTYTLQSPQCEFSRASFEFRSPAAVLLQGRGLHISGIGYDVYGKDQNLLLVIRSTVQINFQRQRFAEGQKSAAPFRHKSRPKTPPTAEKP